MIKLLAETPRDQEMIEKFQRAYENLRKIVENLQKENDRIRNEFEEYKKRHPATVGVKNGKSYDISEDRKVVESWEEASHTTDAPDTSPPSEDKKKPGAQPGHRGFFRKKSKITHRVTVKADLFRCPECSSILVKRGFRNRKIEDIPEIVPTTTQYRIQRMYCKSCRIMVEPDIPHALHDATLSIRAMIIVVYFRVGMRMSIENVSATMENVFGIHVSEGEVQNIMSQMSDALGSEYWKLLDQIKKASYRHMDSTSWRINGENHNLWTFVTRGEAIFHISKIRGHDVPLEILGKHNGTDIHDRHSAFETLASKTGNPQQYCWSHIICDAKELEQFYGKEGSRIKRSLQKIHEEAKALKGKGTMEDMDNLKNKLIFLLTSDYDHPKCRNFVDNLLKRNKDWLFHFVTDPDVESTNNRAERSLRPSVIFRKVSGGSRSHRGSEIYGTVNSIYYTTKLRKQNFIRDVPRMLSFEKRSSKKRPNPG